jgi:hypothetical protein
MEAPDALSGMGATASIRRGVYKLLAIIIAVRSIANALRCPDEYDGHEPIKAKIQVS